MFTAEILADAAPIILAGAVLGISGGIFWFVRKAVRLMIKETTNGDPDSFKSLQVEILKETKATHEAVKAHSEWAKDPKRSFNRDRET